MITVCIFQLLSYKQLIQVSLCQKLLFLHQLNHNTVQCDNKLFIVHENYKLRIPAEHVVFTNCCFRFDIQNNFGTQHVLQMLRASEKYLPVKGAEISQIFR